MNNLSPAPVLKSIPLIKRLACEFIKPYQKHLSYAVLCMVMGALATSALPYSLKPVFDHIFIKGEMDMLVWVCLMIFFAFFVKGIASYGESVLMTYVGQKIITDIQKRLFQNLMQSDLYYFHSTPTGELLSRFTNDVNLMRNAMANTLISIGKDFLTMVFLIGLMFYMDFTLATIAFVVFPTAILPLLKLGKRMRKVTHQTQDSYSDLTNQLSQVFGGIRLVKAYGMEKKEAHYIDKMVDHVFTLIYKSTCIRAASHPIVETLGGIAIISVVAYGGYQVILHERTAGDFMAFIASLLLVYEPLKRLSNLNASLQEGLAAAMRILKMLDNKPTIISPQSSTVLTPLKGCVRFEHVSFSYTQSNIVLDDITFEANPGQKIAFVGMSGAGKSTLINLIPRFYDVTHGTIFIDDIDIRLMHLNDLRAYSALVSQEICLFDRTVAQNIAYSEQAYSLDQIIQAAKAAAAHDFICQLPQGYDTYVGENGVKLSGGQRQRIAIARAMLKNAPILLLDEATSALDSESEGQIQEALNAVMEGRTTLIVAHRLATIMNADCIYVLDQGHIVESGSHGVLLKKKGLYAKLWKKQSESLPSEPKRETLNGCASL